MRFYRIITGAAIPLDDGVDTPQQTGLIADQAILDIRSVRVDEGIRCAR